MSKERTNEEMSRRWALLLGGVALGMIVGQTISERRMEQTRRFRELEASIHELRKKVDPDYKDLNVGGPIPVKVVE